MKTCPKCHRQYQDETIRFCLEDGSVLVQELDPTVLGSAGDQTLRLPLSPTGPAAGRSTQPAGSPQPTMPALGFQAGGPPSSSQDYSRHDRRSPALLWVAGAIIIAGGAIAVALIVTRNRGGKEQPANQTIAAASPAASQVIPSSTPSPTNAADVNLPTPTKTTAAPKGTPTPGIIKSTDRTQPMSTPPPPAPTPQAKPRAPISGGVLNGKATYLAKPAYPAIARAAHASGAVNVQVLVDESGNVISAHAVSGHPLLQSSAVAAARSSRFSPTVLSGQPVKVSGVIVYNFVAQ